MSEPLCQPCARVRRRRWRKDRPHRCAGDIIGRYVVVVCQCPICHPPLPPDWQPPPMSLDAIDAEAESARDERSGPAPPAAQAVGGAPVDPDPARPSGDVCAAIAAALRYAAALAFHTDEDLAQTLYDSARDVELAGADRDVCPLCEEVGCDDDCALAPYRNTR